MKTVPVLLWLTVVAACGDTQRFTSASSSVYVRSDTDRTTIVNPKMAVAAEVAKGTSVDVEYEVDAWSGASVDIVTAATGRVSETRHEINAGAARVIGDGTLSAGYRYSIEPDYQSHGGVLGGRLEVASKNTTLGADLLGSTDVVGRAGDPFFQERLHSGGARLSLAQVIDRKTLADVAVESTFLSGYMASPYRWVAIGGEGTCASGAPFCIPEQIPTQRVRTAAMLRLRRALARTWSAGLEYRFYFDDWGIRSHAAQGDIAWRLESSILSLRYRYYTQGEADFYRPRYSSLSTSDGYVTRDRKLSAFASHEAGVSWLRRWALGEDETHALVGGARLGLVGIDYLAFVGLERVFALEMTATVGIELL